MKPSPYHHFASLFVSRMDDYAVQGSNGLYRRVGAPLTHAVLHAHVQGEVTIGTYVISQRGNCRYAVMDADQPGGLALLAQAQQRLAADGIVSYLEQSHREGHLWVFFQNWAPAATVRWWLRPYCPPGMEFFPKQDTINGYGSLIRLPLGVHRLTDRRYPFITFDQGHMQPVAPTLHEMLRWLDGVQRVEAPTFDVPELRQAPRVYGAVNKKRSMTLTSATRPSATPATISEWCAHQDPLTLIGRYVDLNGQGLGPCPFVDHHTHGQDRHRSFKVFTPSSPGGSCWHCYTWGKGGSVFDFLRLYYNLSARELWRRIHEGARF